MFIVVDLRRSDSTKPDIMLIRWRRRRIFDGGHYRKPPAGYRQSRNSAIFCRRTDGFQRGLIRENIARLEKKGFTFSGGSCKYEIVFMMLLAGNWPKKSLGIDG